MGDSVEKMKIGSGKNKKPSNDDPHGFDESYFSKVELII